MKQMRAAQLTFDGREEAPAKDSGGLREFIKVSAQEDGLLLPAQAAIALDVCRARVFQLMDAGLLQSWDFFGKRYLSVRDLAARRAADVKGGRPKRTIAQRVRATGNILRHSDRAQILSAALE